MTRSPTWSRKFECGAQSGKPNDPTCLAVYLSANLGGEKGVDTRFRIRLCMEVGVDVLTLLIHCQATALGGQALADEGAVVQVPTDERCGHMNVRLDMPSQE